MRYFLRAFSGFFVSHRSVRCRDPGTVLLLVSGQCAVEIALPAGIEVVLKQLAAYRALPGHITPKVAPALEPPTKQKHPQG